MDDIIKRFKEVFGKDKDCRKELDDLSKMQWWRYKHGKAKIPPRTVKLMNMLIERGKEKCTQLK